MGSVRNTLGSYQAALTNFLWNVSRKHRSNRRKSVAIPSERMSSRKRSSRIQRLGCCSCNDVFLLGSSPIITWFLPGNLHDEFHTRLPSAVITAAGAVVVVQL